jgi:hypothetical protein
MGARTMTVRLHCCGASMLGFLAEMALGKNDPGGDNCVMQIDSKTLDALARRLAQVVPPGLNSLGDELERNLKAVLQSSLKNLDLVTREEFDVQRGVLDPGATGAASGQVERAGRRPEPGIPISTRQAMEGIWGWQRHSAGPRQAWRLPA